MSNDWEQVNLCQIVQSCGRTVNLIDWRESGEKVTKIEMVDR